MKKRNVLALALALVMSVGMSSSVFAATWSGSAPNENDVEKVTYNFMNETKSGKYKLVDTATLKNWQERQDDCRGHHAGSLFLQQAARTGCD